MAISPTVSGCVAGWLASQMLNTKSALLEELHCVATCDSTVPLEMTDYDAAAEATSAECFRDVTLQLNDIYKWGAGWSITLAIFYLSLAASIVLGGERFPSPAK